MKNVAFVECSAPWIACTGNGRIVQAWAGQYTRKDKGLPTLALEAVASHDRWIWHFNFGTPGSCNDINILDHSPLMQAIMKDSIPAVEFILNGQIYRRPYWLVDGIYPEWTCFAKPLSEPANEKAQFYTKMQEATRKDVECAFGILQSKFHIISQPSNFWFSTDMRFVIACCVILHNMVIEDEQHDITNDGEEDDVDNENLRQREDRRPHQMTLRSYAAANAVQIQPPRNSFAKLLQNRTEIRNSVAHLQLRENLIHHLWEFRGSQTGT